MTNTEIIAVKLFGWTLDGPCQCDLSGCTAKEFTGPHGSRIAVEQGRAFDLKPCSNHYWPDFTDYNWIRRMENKLLEKELLEEYVNVLWKLAPDEYPWCENYQILSTAEQRVEACVKVLGVEG